MSLKNDAIKIVDKLEKAGEQYLELKGIRTAYGVCIHDIDEAWVSLQYHEVGAYASDVVFNLSWEFIEGNAQKRKRFVQDERAAEALKILQKREKEQADKEKADLEMLAKLKEKYES